MTEDSALVLCTHAAGARSTCVSAAMGVPSQWRFSRDARCWVWSSCSSACACEKACAATHGSCGARGERRRMWPGQQICRAPIFAQITSLRPSRCARPIPLFPGKESRGGLGQELNGGVTDFPIEIDDLVRRCVVEHGWGKGRTRGPAPACARARPPLPVPCSRAYVA